MKYNGKHIIIYDFEVFCNDVLLGCLICDGGDEPELYQTWDLKSMYDLYLCSKDVYIWVGHNNVSYDDRLYNFLISQFENTGTCDAHDIYLESQKIISHKPYEKLPRHFASYDVMKSLDMPWSLKTSEAAVGKSIETTEVSFDIQRPLTDEEKAKTEYYNRCDLDQTLYNFGKFYEKFSLRRQFVEETNFDTYDAYSAADRILIERKFDFVNKSYANSAKPAIGYQRILYPELELENEYAKRFYLDGDLMSKKSSNLHFGSGYDTIITNGGLRGARPVFACDRCIEIDAVSLYPTLMIQYDMFPCNMTGSDKETYKDIYDERIRIKKTNPQRQKLLKVILNSVYGLTSCEYSQFYEFGLQEAIAITGALFMLDLMEKLDPYVDFVQNNTDGIIFVPKDWDGLDKIRNIVGEWSGRTRINMEETMLVNYHQRDINNYCCRTADGKTIAKGEMFKTNAVDDESFVSGALFNYTEPPIIARACLDYFLDGVKPEETVEKYKNNLLYFAYICRKGNYKEMIYSERSLKDFSSTEMVIQNPSRAFASNNLDIVGSIRKRSDNRYSKIPNTPDNLFVYNGEILSAEAIEKTSGRIDYRHYVDRAYAKIGNGGM